jgi:hypothetical protein
VEEGWKVKVEGVYMKNVGSGQKIIKSEIKIFLMH